MNSTLLYENFTFTLNSTLSNDLTFKDIISSPFFYGSSIILLFLLLCVISIICFIKNKQKLLFSTNLWKKSKKNIWIFSYINKDNFP